MIEEWNIAEIERILDWSGEQGFVFATQIALKEKCPILRLIANQRYLELVRKIIERRKQNVQPINGTPRSIETLLRFGDFQCFPTMFPRVYPNGDVFYPCEPLRENRRQLLARGFIGQGFLAERNSTARFPSATASVTCSETWSLTTTPTISGGSRANTSADLSQHRQLPP